MDSAARSAETVNAWHTAGRMSRQPRQRHDMLSRLPARDIGERQPPEVYGAKVHLRKPICQFSTTVIGDVRAEEASAASALIKNF